MTKKRSFHVENPRFQSYQPRHEDLKKFQRPIISAAKIEEELNSQMDEVLRAAQDEKSRVSVLPRRANWDLKRIRRHWTEEFSSRYNQGMHQLLIQEANQTSGSNEAKADEVWVDGDKAERKTELGLRQMAAKISRTNYRSDDTHDAITS